MPKENKTLIESAKNFIEEYPKLDELAHFGINYADNIDLNYAIDEVPSTNNGIRAQYLDGSSERELLFQFAAILPFSQSAETNIKANAFFEELADWIELRELKEDYPDLPEGLTPIGLEVASPAYFAGAVSETLGRYQMTIRIIYDKGAMI